MRFGFCLLTLTLLAGCSGERHSYLEFVCPVGKPGYVAVAFRTPTGDWEFNGHALLLHETIRTFSLHLPESPPDPARYSYERLQLIETTPYPEVGVPLKGGHVALDGAGANHELAALPS